MTLAHCFAQEGYIVKSRIRRSSAQLKHSGDDTGLVHARRRNSTTSKLLRNVNLGYYDNDRFVALLGLHDDPEALNVTLQHEYLHHFLNIATGHGLLIRRVVRDINAERNVDENTELLDFLSETCRTVQEAHATYVSLRLLGNKSLLPKLASEYHTYYASLEKLVEPVFDSSLMSTSFATAIARACMMNYMIERCEEHKTFTYGFITAHLRQGEWPDKRLEIILENKHLLNKADVLRVFDELWSIEQNKLLFECESTYELSEHFHGDDGAYSDAVANLGVMLLYVLFELLKPVFPDLEDEYRTYRFSQMTSGPESSMSVGDKYGHLGDLNSTSLQGFLHRFAQTVKIQDNAELPVRVGPPPGGVKETISALATKFGTVCMYARLTPRLRKPKFYLADIQHGDVQLYPIAKDSQDLLNGHAVPGVTVVIGKRSYDQWLAYSERRRRSSDTHLEQAFEQACVHVDQSVPEFMSNFLRTQQVIRLAPFGFGYAAGPYAGILGLEMCLYEIGDNKALFFHLSNAFMTEGITGLVELIGKSDRIKVDPDLLKRHAHTISKLIDHPILNFYLLGENPESIFQ